jgi:hypothetical protein
LPGQWYSASADRVLAGIDRIGFHIREQRKPLMDMKLALANVDKSQRESHFSQVELAADEVKPFRVSKIEAGDPSVSLDLLVRQQSDFRCSLHTDPA